MAKWMMRAGPARVLRKEAIVAAGPERLPVFTLTFAQPESVEAFRMDMGDVVKIVVPGYKPKSYSVSAMRPGEFDVTFKVYPNGRASGYLDRLAIGDDATVFRRGNKSRFAGRFVGLVAYGVGITEALPVAAAEVEKGDAERVTLLWANRTAADAFWGDRIADLEATGKFTLVSIFSRERHDDALHGRITADVLQRVFGPDIARVEGDAKFLSVGTKLMMAETDAMFAAIGCPMPAFSLFTGK
eukprot:CAMPEP_0197394678 /NCGR_PEP_ID=MMETSP1165-20131217/5776_1 /TAXON_ID=284809 /ORGANISM="Chrysocystis fragilis, Strain CCMP3189" /LENGTH=242 /DNA_ID=CAMNT_0042920403 /DNA_START=53 /DNA_END=781 /DNA_ORIENTATION=+